MPCDRFALFRWSRPSIHQTMITTLQLHQSSRKKRPNLRFLSFLGLTFTLLLDGKCRAEHINPLETESPVNFDLPSVMTVTPVSDRCNEVVVKLRLCALTNPNQPKPVINGSYDQTLLQDYANLGPFEYRRFESRRKNTASTIRWMRNGRCTSRCGNV